MINTFRKNLGGISRAAVKTSHDRILNSIVEYPRFCSVTFKKNDGTICKLHGRTGVKKHLKGTGATRSSAVDNQYILFWDKKVGYRNINRNNIIAVNGLNLKIEG